MPADSIMDKLLTSMFEVSRNKRSESVVAEWDGQIAMITASLSGTGADLSMSLFDVDVEEVRRHVRASEYDMISMPHIL